MDLTKEKNDKQQYVYGKMVENGIFQSFKESADMRSWENAMLLKTFPLLGVLSLKHTYKLFYRNS